MRRTPLALTAAATLVGSLALGGHGQTAHADFFFCWGDPGFSMDGTTVHVYVGVPTNDIHSIRGTVPVAGVVTEHSHVHVTQNGPASPFPEQAHVFTTKHLDQIADFLGVSSKQLTLPAHLGDDQMVVFSIVHTNGTASFNTYLTTNTSNPGPSSDADTLMAITVSVP